MAFPNQWQYISLLLQICVIHKLRKQNNKLYNAKGGAVALQRTTKRWITGWGKPCIMHYSTHFAFPKWVFPSHQDLPQDKVQGAAPLFILLPHPTRNGIQYPKTWASLWFITVVLRALPSSGGWINATFCSLSLPSLQMDIWARSKFFR